MVLKRELEQQLAEANRLIADLCQQVKLNNQPSIEAIREKLWQEAVIEASRDASWTINGKRASGSADYAAIADNFLKEFDKRFKRG